VSSPEYDLQANREERQGWKDSGAAGGCDVCLAYLKAAQSQGSGDLEEARQAAVLLGAAEARREAMGAPIQPANHAHHTRQVQAIHSRLGPDAFNVAWQVGRALRIDQAIEGALEGV
jgi:hypothetical protein